MFSNKERPLPNAIFSATPKQKVKSTLEGEGVMIGENCYWNPEKAPNPHGVIIGTSGSGKTQTLKAIASELVKLGNYRVVMFDMHGDLELPGEVCYPLNMASKFGVNPLEVNLDPEGGGSNLQALVVAESLKRSLLLGVNQHGYLIQALKECYLNRGILNNDRGSWAKSAPNFSDLQELLELRVEDGDKEATKLLIKLYATFQFGIFSRPQPDWTDAAITRIDLCKLPSELGVIAVEAIAQQIFNARRLAGEGNSSHVWIIIDEAKLIYKSPAIDTITTEGRKFSVGAIVASQSERHMSADLLGNASFKCVLAVDQMETRKVASKFRFDEKKIAALKPLQALVRIGKDGVSTNVVPYWQRSH